MKRPLALAAFLLLLLSQPAIANNLAPDYVELTDAPTIMVFNVNPTYLSSGPTNGACNSGTYGNGEKACYVLGQTSFSSTSSGVTQALMAEAGSGIGYDTSTGYLYVPDSNARVMIFNTASLSNGMNATDEIGQYNGATTGTLNWTQTGTNNYSGSRGFNTPNAMVLDPVNHRFFVAEAGNNRVTGYTLNTNNSFSSLTFSYLLGQTAGNYSSSSVNQVDAPVGMAYDSVNNRLFVSDNSDGEVHIYSSAVTNAGGTSGATYGLGGSFANACNQTEFSGISNGLAYDSTHQLLYVADWGNRVLVFNVGTNWLASGSSTGNTGCGTTHGTGEAACYVLGQADFTHCTANQGGGAVPGQATLFEPAAVVLDPVNYNLFVADYANNRVMVFPAYGNASWTGNGENASYVLGQSNFSNHTAGTTQSVMSQPMSLAYDANNNRLFEGERGNNRVMSFNVGTGVIANGENASFELGQANYTTNGANLTQSGMEYPAGLVYDSTNQLLYVADGNIGNGAGFGAGEGYHRISVFNVAVPAWSTVSQGSDDSCGITTDSLLYCWGYNHYGELGLGNTTQFTSPQAVDASVTTWSAVTVQYDGTNDGDACGIASGDLYCWGYNHRGELGLGNTTQFTSPQQVGAATNWTSVSFGDYDTCGVAGTQLYCWGYNHQYENGVATNTENNSPVAVTGIDSVGNDENASDLLGEYSNGTSTALVEWTQNGPNNGPNALGFYGGAPAAIDIVHHYFYVADSQNSRLLVYTLNTDNSFPSGSGGHTASYLLGQTSLWGKNAIGSEPTGMKNTTGAAVDTANQRLFVANRYTVEVFNTSSFSNGMSASYYLGTGANGCTQTEMSSPSGVAYDAANSRLFVADSSCNRVLVFNVATGSIANGENASYELGQPSGVNAFTTSGTALTQSGMSNPNGIAYDATNNRLFVADSSNDRVLVFNVNPSTIANGENASYVLGQSSFTANGVAVTQSGMDTPQGVSYDPNSGRLFVADVFGMRVLVYNVNPSTIANGENASFELGQASGASAFTSNAANITQSGFNRPSGVLYDPGSSRLFVQDNYNYRILIFDGTTISTDAQHMFLPGYE